MKIVKTFILFLVFSFLALATAEWGVRKLCHSRYGQKTCFFNFPESNSGLDIWIQNLDPHFGVWNKPNVSNRRVSSCYDMLYKTNSYGARDRERIQNFDVSNNEKLKNRVVFLGDSWIEGMGVAQEATIPNLLENKTGIEHLNFGIGGFNSPLQYLLRYIYLAKKFDHEVIMVGILPFNDFDDMNLEVGRVLHSDKVRPYLVGTYPDKKIEYFNKDKKDSSESTLLSRCGDALYSWSYLFRMMGDAVNKFAAKNKLEKLRSSDGWNALHDSYSRYDHFNEEEFSNLKWVLKKFSEEADHKKLVFFTFPTLQDLKTHEGSSLEHNTLSDRMSVFLKELKNSNILYIDLLPLLKKNNLNPESLFLMCDGHMNEHGNQVVSELIYQQLKGKIY